MKQEAKKNLFSLLIPIGIMVLASVLVIVAFIVTYKFVTKPNDFDEIFGEGYKEVEVLKGSKDNVSYTKFEVKGDVEGFVYQGRKYHEFDPGTDIVKGYIGIKIATDKDGKILGVAFYEYGHSTTGNWQEITTEYFEAYKDTNLEDVVETHAANSDIMASATQSSTTVYDILLILKGVK